LTAGTQYDDVLAHLAGLRVRFVVTGGVSIALRGLARPVMDLDVVVDPVPQNVGLVSSALTQLGFWPTLPLPLDVVPVMRMMDANHREVDVNRLYPITFAALIERADHLTVSSQSIAVISVADLIAIKEQRRRDYDLLDIELLRSLQV
jgi:hypothetical protein